MIYGCRYIIKIEKIAKMQRREVILMQTEINYQQLGQRVREKRKAMNVQQKDMAIAIGTATNHLSDIERGRKKPSLELLMRISSFLDLCVAKRAYQCGADWPQAERRRYSISLRLPLPDRSGKNGEIQGCALAHTDYQEPVGTPGLFGTYGAGPEKTIFLRGQGTNICAGVRMENCSPYP